MNLEIYAELTRKQYKDIVGGNVGIEIPDGVTMKNPKGSRGLHFSCQDEVIAKMLMDALDEDGISWQ
jgi:hypothetical protein